MPHVRQSASLKAQEVELFRHKRSQAVRIPAAFELPGERALIRRQGHRLIIEPIAHAGDIEALLELWRAETRSPQAAGQPPEPDDTPLGPEDVF